MKDRILTNNIRNIKKSFLRFLSLMVMAALGVYAFTGLMAVAPDMINSLDRVLDERNAYDIKIISDMGLDQEDIGEIEKLPSIKTAEGVCYRDSSVFFGTTDGIVNINSLPVDINSIELISGEIPVQKNEIAVEDNLLKKNDLSIGDIIHIDDEEGFYEKDVVITGVVDSPLFYNSVKVDANRGDTNVGAGTINYYAYVPVSNFKQDYISVIYATVEGAADLETGSKEYVELVQSAIDEIEGIKDERQKTRYDNIIKTADDKIEEESGDAKAQLENAKTELEKAKRDLEDAFSTISDGEKQLEDAKIELDKAGRKLDEAQKELSDKEKDLSEGKKLLEDAGRQIGEKEAQLYEARSFLENGLNTLNQKSTELENGRSQLEAGKKVLDEKQRLADESAALISKGETDLEKAQKEIEKAINEAAAGKKELDEKQEQIDEGEKKIEQGREALEKSKQQLDEAKTAFSYIQKEYDSIVSSEHFTEDMINSEIKRMQKDLDTLKWIFDKLITEYRQGDLTIDKAKEIIQEAISDYSREPTLLETVVFYRIALLYLEPLIREGDEEYNKALKELESAENQLEEGKKALEEGKRQYNEAMKKISDGQDKITSGQKELDLKKKELDSGLRELKKAYNEYDQARKLLEEGEALLSGGYKEYESNMNAFLEGKLLFDEMKEEYLTKSEELLLGEEMISTAKAQLEAGKKEYNAGLDTYNKKKKELEEGKSRYEDGKAQYRSGLAEYEKGRANFDEEIKKARENIDGLNIPSWYIYDRTGYSIYSDFFEAGESIQNLSRVFPIVFFLVAVLVSLISMSRMVEMDRMEIGTLKSMGFSTAKVISKYALFAILATATGCVIGAVLGLTIMPSVIFGIYGILFDLPKFYLGPNWGITIAGIATVMVLVVGSGMLKVFQVMREKPSELLRPKAPKPGKRVIMEKIPFIWKRLKFSDKITVRNLFRYKRRFFVTVFSIIGCTSLILCGFGLKDAIVDIPEKQFGEVFKMDAMSYLTGLDNDESDSQKLKKLFDEKEIVDYTESMRIKGITDGYDINILAFDNSDEINKVINTTDSKTGKAEHIEQGKVLITQKIASLTNTEAGDNITFIDLNHKEHNYTVSGIINNYFEHYIIMDKSTLEDHTKYIPNLLFLDTVEMTDEQEKDLSKKLLKNPNILNVTYKDTLTDSAEKMLGSLDKVVVILILLSAALAIVVLYNLSNINIKERHREIATLKVLGFYDKEVDDYINKENIIMTVIGIAAGLLLGILLTKLVVGTVEIKKASFINYIKPLSYIISAAMSAGFTLLVNQITHFNLKRIEMIDSLKSVE